MLFRSHRVVIDPTNPNTVYVAAIGNPYAEHPERGVFKTTDGGETWSKILYVNDTTGCADLVMDPSNPNKIIAAMWQFRRRPWELKSGGVGSGLYMTVDGGKNWKKMGKEEGMPEGPLGRIGIAFARSTPSRVYAKVEATKNGLYKSEDGGFSWQLVNSNPADVTDRPFYYQEIYVDPKNENRIYDVHSTITLSEDGGKSFSTLIPYSGIHPDHHAWWINPENPNLIIEGNDGGIGVSRDRGKSWTFDEKIPVGQFYHVNVDNETPYNVMGGMQDNGSWHGPAYVWINGGIRNYYWHNVGGGDGFDVMPDAEDASWVFSESQGGSFGRRNWKTGESWFIKPTPAVPTQLLRFNWNTPMAQDPFDSKTIYLGSQFVHKSLDKGASWQPISSDLTTNDSVKIKAFQNTGGLTLDITGAETYCSLLTIAPSAKQKGVIWTGSDDGQVQLTKDGGQTWTGPVRVNDDAINNGKTQDMVWASYNENGDIAVTWRDRRNAPANGFWNAGYDFYYALSYDNGQTFSANQKLSNQFIDFDSVLTQNGNDFMSCVFRGDTLYTVWGDTRNGKMNIYFSKTIASTNTNVGIWLLNEEKNNWYIFPNPATEELNLITDASETGDEIFIYDTNGKTFWAGKVTSPHMHIQLNKFANGTYYLKTGKQLKSFIKR